MKQGSPSFERLRFPKMITGNKVFIYPAGSFPILSPDLMQKIELWPPISIYLKICKQET